MRQSLTMNSNLFHRMGMLETRAAETESHVKNIMKMIGHKIDLPRQGIFFDGQTYDAYTFVADLKTYFSL